MRKEEWKFIQAYQDKSYHSFREIERYAHLLDKLQVEADKKLTI